MSDGKSTFTSQQHVPKMTDANRYNWDRYLDQYSRAGTHPFGTDNPSTTIEGLIHVDMALEERCKALETKVEMLECMLDDITNNRDG